MKYAYKKEFIRLVRTQTKFTTPLTPDQVILLWEGNVALSGVRAEYELILNETELGSTECLLIKRKS